MECSSQASESLCELRSVYSLLALCPAGYDFQDTSRSLFNPVIMYNSTYANFSTNSGPPSLVRFARSLNLVRRCSSNAPPVHLSCACWLAQGGCQLLCSFDHNLQK